MFCIVSYCRAPSCSGWSTYPHIHPTLCLTATLPLNSKLTACCTQTHRLPQTLGNYLAWRGASALAGRTIVELGAGTGLVGFVAGALGGDVLITDQACVTARAPAT